MPPEIDLSKCDGCGECIEICSEDVFYGTPNFGKNGEKPVVGKPDLCWHGNCCVKVCHIPGAIWLRIPMPMTLAFK